MLAEFLTAGASIVAAPFLLPMLIPLGTAQTLCVYRGHTQAVFAVAWSPDSTYIASVSTDQTLQIWTVEEGKRVLRYPIVIEFLPVGLTWSPTGRYLAFGAVSESAIQVLDTVTGHLQSSHNHDASQESFALTWSPDGTRLASGGDNGNIEIWDALTGTHLNAYSCDPLGMPVSALAWYPDSTRIAAGQKGGKSVVLDASNGHVLCFYLGQTRSDGTNMLTSLAWSPDGKLVASGVSENDNTAQIWSGITGEHVVTYRKKNNVSTGGVYVFWSPLGLRVASSQFAPDTIDVWPVGCTHAFTYLGHQGYIYNAAWSPDGTCIASCSDDHSVQVWRAL